MHNTMTTTLRHDPNLYLNALLYHRSDQRYLQLKCLECLKYQVTTQASLGISQYSLHMPSLCKVLREVGNDNPWPDFRSTPVFSREGLPKAIFSLVMLLVIVLAAVSENVLKKILEWYAQHKNIPAPTQDDDADSRKKTTDIEEWDQKFMQVDQEIVLTANYIDIHKVTLAANYMDINALLDVGCKNVANMIEGKPADCKTSTQGRNVGHTLQNDDADCRKKTTDIKEWDQKFMQVDREIILAANYIDIKAFLDVGCKTVANMIKGEPPEEIRKTFNIQNDFTPEEEDQIRRGNEWVDSRLEERNLLTKKTAGAGVSATLPTRRRGVTSFKKRPGSRDVPVVSSMSDFAIVDAFPCRAFIIGDTRTHQVGALAVKVVNNYDSDNLHAYIQTTLGGTDQKRLITADGIPSPVERPAAEIITPGMRQLKPTPPRSVDTSKLEVPPGILTSQQWTGSLAESFILGGAKCSSVTITTPIPMLTGRIYISDGELSLGVLQSDNGISLQSPAFQNPYDPNFNTSFKFKASSAGLVQLTKSLATERARHQIRVNRSASTPSAVPSSI